MAIIEKITKVNILNSKATIQASRLTAGDYFSYANEFYLISGNGSAVNLRSGYYLNDLSSRYVTPIKEITITI